MLRLHLRRQEKCRDPYRGLEPSSRLISDCSVVLAIMFVLQIMFGFTDLLEAESTLAEGPAPYMHVFYFINGSIGGGFKSVTSHKLAVVC